MTPEEIISYLREPMARVGDNEAAALIESLQSERDTLAFRVVQMREALEARTLNVLLGLIEDSTDAAAREQASMFIDYRQDVLALTPTAAEERAKANAEAAAQVPGLVEQLRIKSKAIEDVLDLIQNSEGVAGLHLNGDEAPWSSLRKGGQFEEWLHSLDVAANLDVSEAEAQSKANAEKAAEYDAVLADLALKSGESGTLTEMVNGLLSALLLVTESKNAAETKARANAEKAAALDALVDFLLADSSGDVKAHEKAGNLLHPFMQARAAKSKAMNWADTNRERGILIDKHITGTLNEEERARLEELQAYTDHYIEKVAQRPTAVLDELEGRFIKGIAAKEASDEN